MRILTLLAVMAFVMATSNRADAYRFFDWEKDSGAIPSAADALRWHIASFPLHYHLQDNIPDYLDEAEWRAIVEESFAAWSEIRTADIRLSLEPGLVKGIRNNKGHTADVNDGKLTIGWVVTDHAWGSAAVAAEDLNLRRRMHCDITMYAGSFSVEDGAERSDVLAKIRMTLRHEIGHCLGLSHTEPHPYPVWLGRTGHDRHPISKWKPGNRVPSIPPSFLPDTIMSYAAYNVNITEDDCLPTENDCLLAEDDRIGVSLLYPSFGFSMARGAVTARLVRMVRVEGPVFDAVPFAYVQAVYPGSLPRMGPGTFSDSDGYFHLEGLEPGMVLLWIHPILLQGRRNAHGGLLGDAWKSGGIHIADQWQWVKVTADHIASGPDIRLSTVRQ